MSRKVEDSSGRMEMSHGGRTQGQGNKGEGEPYPKVLESQKQQNEERQPNTKGCPNTRNDRTRNNRSINETSQTDKRKCGALDVSGKELSWMSNSGHDMLQEHKTENKQSDITDVERAQLCQAQTSHSKGVHVSFLESHVVHEHEGCRAEGVFEGEPRRGVSDEVHEDSVTASLGRVGRRSKSVCQGRQGSHPTSPDGGGFESGGQEEVRTSTPRPAGPGFDDHRKRNDRPVEDQGHGEGIRVGHSDPGGLRGIWRTCRTDIRRGDSSSPPVCSVGSEDYAGRPVLPEVEAFGQMGRERGATTGGDSQDDREQDQGLHKDGDQEWELEQQQLGLGELGGPVGGVSEAIDRGGQGQPGPPPQEDRRGREFFDRMGEDVRHSLTVNPTGSPTYEPDDGLGPTGFVKSLDPSTARKLDVMAARMGPDNFQEVVASGRPLLFEIACGPESLLTTHMKKLTGKESSAQRLSFWNGYDLTKSQGVRSVMSKIDKDRPMHVWLSLECGPFSRMQNVNQRNDKQKEELSQKRANCIRQYVGGLLIYAYCVQEGIPVTWEWSETCDAWRLPMVQKVFRRYPPLFSVVKGCRVDLRDPKSRAYLGKGWKLATTHELLAKRMHLPCVCQEKHVLCQGSLTRMSAYYTETFAKRVCKAILDGLDFQDLTSELLGQKSFPREFQGSCQGCSCKVVRHPKSELRCNHCERSKEKSDPLSLVGELVEAQEPLSDEEKQRCLRKLMMLHRNTGHGPREHLVKALEVRGTDPRIVELARNLDCPACQEAKRQVPRPHATLDPLPPKLATPPNW